MPTEVSRINQPGSIGIQLCDKGVELAARFCGLECAGGYGKPDPLRRPGQIRAARGVNRQPLAQIVRSAAEVSRIAQDGVDDQGPVRSVISELKADFAS